MSQVESINLLYLLGSDLLVQSTESQDTQTTNTTKASSGAMENVQEEDSTHGESPS